MRYASQKRIRVSCGNNICQLACIVVAINLDKSHVCRPEEGETEVDQQIVNLAESITNLTLQDGSAFESLLKRTLSE